MIRIDGELRRGDFRLVIDLSIDHRLTAVIGANGAGKTSMLRALCGLDPLAAGRLMLDGRVLDDRTEGVFVPAHERPFAMAFQDHRLFPHLRVIDNVAYPLRRRGVPRDDARSQVGDVLESTGLADLATTRPAALSGGQRQRVAIARALATPADVLLLDEPLASVDDESRSLLRRLFTHVTHRHVIWVTHDPTDADRADTVISIDSGAIRQTAGS